MPLVVLDAGEAHEVLAGRADDAGLSLWCRLLVLGHQALFGLVGVEAPDVVGGVDDAAALGDLEVDGRVGRALDDDDLVARAGELRRDVAARGALAVAAGERRQEVHAVAVAAEHGRAADRPDDEDELVVGAQRLDLGADLVEQVVRADALAADVARG